MPDVEGGGRRAALEGVSKPEPNALASGAAVLEATPSRPEASAYGSISEGVEVLKCPLETNARSATQTRGENRAFAYFQPCKHFPTPLSGSVALLKGGIR